MTTTVARRYRLTTLLALGLCCPSAFCEDWLGWAGPRGDFTVEAGKLAETWPEDGPRRLWQRPLGGGRLLEIADRDGGTDVRELWFKPHLRASHWPLIRLDDWIYGSIGGNDVWMLATVCWETGEIAWRERGYHKAQALWAEGKLLFLDQDGKLNLARVTPERLEILTSAQIAKPRAWTLPTLIGTTLYLRDEERIFALDLAAGPELQR